MTSSLRRRASTFTDSPRLRLRLALPDSQTRLASGCGSRYQIHRLASPPAAARATTFSASVAISREANGVRGLESPPEVVRQDDPEPALGAGAKSERDEGMIAEGGGQREPTDRRVPVEDVQLLQIEGLPGLDELPLPELQPRSARVLDLDLDVDDLAGPDPAIGDELRDPDRGRAELVGARLARRRRGPGAPTRTLGDRDRPRGPPAGVATALGRRRDLGDPMIEPHLEGHVDLTIQRREVEHALEGNVVSSVARGRAWSPCWTSRCRSPAPSWRPRRDRSSPPRWASRCTS